MAGQLGNENVLQMFLRGRMFFFEKKNQKTFARCRGAVPGAWQASPMV
jgi:hypothetical protein